MTGKNSWLTLFLKPNVFKQIRINNLKHQIKSSSKKRTLFASIADQKRKAKVCICCDKSGHSANHSRDNPANHNNKLSEKENAAAIAALSEEMTNILTYILEISCDLMILQSYEAIKLRNLRNPQDFRALKRSSCLY